MPYHVAKSSKCPASRPYAVVKDSDGHVMGCHPSQSAANKQLAALYAQENNSMTDLRNLPDPVRERLTEGFGSEFLTERHRGFDLDFKGKPVEERTTPHRLEVRAAQDGAPVIAGYATVYDYAYDVAGGPPIGWSETISEGAAAKSIAEKDDVYLFFDHEGFSLASTKDGTLSLESDKIGLYNESRIDQSSPHSMEVVRRLQSGALDAMSFAFKTLRQEWNDDYTERRITELKLFDVSVVSFPANPATFVQLRKTARDNQVAEVLEQVGQSDVLTLAAAQALADALRLYRRTA